MTRDQLLELLGQYGLSLQAALDLIQAMGEAGILNLAPQLAPIEAHIEVTMR